jgi:xylose isomerase
MTSSFESLPPVRFEGPHTANPLAYRHYDADALVLGKPMAQHLRLAVCYWHTLVWPGSDVFGQGTFERPWHAAGDELTLARRKADAAFALITRLGVPFYTFHDTDVAPEGANLAQYRSNLAAMVDVLAQKQEETGVGLLWGTANLFGHPRYAAGAASNPDPEVFAYAATQVYSALNATHRLGGANYVMWGGREGYDTLLNTDLSRERRQLGRFMQMVVEHKHKVGFKGQLLIEPKPLEPTKHQYDFDCATVYGFLREFGLEREIRLNIEANHATLAGHSFQHEIATAMSLGIFGSIDANRGDPQNGWDTDQFPNSVEDLTLALYEILQGRRHRLGRVQLRRQGAAPEHGSRRPPARPCRRDRRARARAQERRAAGGAGRARAVPGPALRGLGRRPGLGHPVRGHEPEPGGRACIRPRHPPAAGERPPGVAGEPRQCRDLRGRGLKPAHARP